MNQLDAKAERALPALFKELGLGPVRSVRSQRDRGDPDVVVRAGGRVYVVEIKAEPRVGSARHAAERLLAGMRGRHASAVPLLVAPHVGPEVAKAVRDAGVSYLDLSGNAHIEAPGLLVHVEGKPNLFVRRGRPASVFAPKSGRIARLLLLDPNRFVSQTELANRSGLGRGFVSRIVGRLRGDALLESGTKGTFRPRAPELLLDAWSADYSFTKHHVVPVTVPSKGGADLMRVIAQRCKQAGLDHAFTGLGAAWAYDEFALFRLVTVYVPRPQDVDRVLGPDAGDDARGANLWVVVPNDAGVFDGAGEVGGVRCVSRVQAWLDLLAMPERAREAADQMRSTWLEAIRRA